MDSSQILSILLTNGYITNKSLINCISVSKYFRELPCNNIIIRENFLEYLHKQGVRNVLLYACLKGRIDIVKYLHKQGIDIKDKTVLKNACKWGHIDIVKYLHEQGMYIKDKTTLKEACTWGHEDIVKYLSEQGMDVINFISTCNVDILVAACIRNDIDTVKFLFNYGMGIEHMRAKDNMALRRACKWGRINIVKLLFKNGLTIDDARKYHNSAFATAFKHGHLEVVKYLTKKGLTLYDIIDGTPYLNPFGNIRYTIIEYLFLTYPGLIDMAIKYGINRHNIKMQTFIKRFI